MVKLKIKNFGPIRDGLTENDGWIEFKKVTVFIGNQATGKSCVAKLYSTFRWLEKELFKNLPRTTKMSLESGGFVKNQLMYHNLSSYIHPNTDIEYIGEKYHFTYKCGIFNVVEEFQDKNYSVPKVMYVPAERNFLTAIQFAAKVESLPKALSEFQVDYRKGLRKYKKGLEIPISNLHVEYNEDEDVTYIYSHSNTKDRKDDKPIPLHHGSSGIQSVIPLYVATCSEISDIMNHHKQRKDKLLDHLRFRNESSAEDIEGAEQNINWRKQYLNEQIVALNSTIAKYNSEITRMQSNIIKSTNVDLDFKNKIISLMTETVKNHNKLATLHLEREHLEDEEKQKSLDYRLINIVEEPEQNLFPTSQQIILYKLIEFANEMYENKDIDNELIITTHSPYLLSYITLLVKGSNTQELAKTKLKNNSQLNSVLHKLYKLVPEKSLLRGSDLAIYYTNDGEISLLDNYEGMPTDDNALNSALEETNTLYTSLLRLQSRSIDNTRE